MLKTVCATLAVAATLIAVAGLAYVKGTGLSARATPGAVETAVARRLRAFAVPAEVRARLSPVPRSEESIRNGLEHFADHCATCHANDGSGAVEMGRGMFPPAPDMRRAATQDLTDGELFYIIEHGVRFTGMPGWQTGTPDGEETTWHLVNFIRHLPAITPEEVAAMEAINPRPPSDVRQEIEAERFLQGEDVPPSPEGAGHAH